MDITLLGSAKYVEDRYKDLKRKRPDEKEQAPASEAALVDGISAAKRYEALMSPSPSQSVVAALDQGALVSTLDDLEHMWPMTQLEKKHTVLYLLLDQLANTDAKDVPTKRSPPALPLPEDETDACESLPLSTQMAVKLFFKLLQSVRSRSTASGNFAPLGRLIEQVPAMLLDMPPLALAPEPGTKSPTVFEEMFGTIVVALPQLADVGHSISALVGLSIKRGRLEHLLLVLKQLLSMDPTVPLPSTVGVFLRELVTAVAQPTEATAETATSTGMLMSFGKGDHGKLGHGSCTHTGCADGRCTENKTTPMVVEATREITFRKIDSLSTHSVAITMNGELMSWGNGDKYRLGHGDAAKEYAPRLVDAFRDKPRVQDVACGLGHTVVLLVNGDVYAWGNGGNGRLGLGDTSDQMQPCKVALPDELVEKESDAWLVSAVFCGASHSLAVTKHGHLFAWGKNNQGQCGVGHTNDELRPAQVSYFDEADMRVSTVAGGWEHTLICTTDGKAFACGCGYKDSRRAGLPPVLGLGINDTDRRTKPTQIPNLDQCIAVACGWDHSLAITKDGSVFTWGSGSNGKLGHGDEENRDVPTMVLGLSGKVVRDVRAGCEHTTAITASGEMYTWGHSDSGRLGHGDNVTRKTPCYVEAFAWQGVRPVAIAVGDKYNLVLVQPVGDDNGSSNQVVDADATPAPVADNDVDTMATTAWTVGAVQTTMLEQLHRLAHAYVPRENAALVEKLRQVHTHPTPLPPSLAYVVDVSASTFELLLEILLLDVHKTKTSTTLGCVHLIQANLLRFLSCAHVTLPSPLLTKLHTALQTLATTMDGETAMAAATALKIGFSCFYASPAAQHALFWDLLLVPEASHLVLLDALVDPLCQDHVVLGLMGRLFGQLGSHTCAIDAGGADASAPTVADLLTLLLRLVTSCVETRPDTLTWPLQLRVLSVLQTHLFACWHAPRVYCIDCVGAVLKPYLESLFSCCLVLLKTVHRGLLKDSDLSTLQPSFFHALAPLAIECCCVSRLRSSEAFCLRLLPMLLPMLKLLDEIAYKATQDHRSSNQSPSMDLMWISELENALALLVGRYTCALIGSSRPPMSPPPTTFPTTLRWLCRYGHIVDGTTAPSALRHWEENGVFEVENELQGDTTPLPNVTLEHVAICDWWAGHGTLQHLDTWMRYHMQHSWDLPLASVESTPGLGPLLLWHTGLTATALSFASSIDVLAPLEPGAPTTPPEALLQLWVLLTSMLPMTSPLHDDIFLVQARRLLTYYPSHCSWTLATIDATPTSHCSFSGCALFVPRACTLSAPHLVSLLQSPLSWPSERLDDDDDRIALKIGGLSILHDLLRQLTSSAAKCELLRVLYERLEVDVDAGCFSVAYNAWQEPRVVFASASSSPRKSKRRRDSDASPLQILERDLHTFHGHVEHGKLAKAIENLYVRSAKVLASAESDPLLKKRALTLWTVHFHDVSLIRRAGILHVLGDLLATDAPAFAMNAASDAIYSSPHAAPAHSCLPPRLRPIEKLVAGATTTRSLHNAAWHVFAWLGRQLMLSTEASTEALSRPSSAKPSLHCTSPRKRLSLPPKLVSATLDESLAHTYTVVLDELRRVASQLAKWNALAHSMVQCLDDSQAILLADPNVVSSTNAVFLSAKERASFDWSTDGFAISLFLYTERDEKEASAATPGASMLLLANGDVATHELALSLCPDGRIGLQLRIEGTSVDVAVVSARPLPWGHWTHLVGRFNPSSRRLEIFVDGMLDAQSECIEVAAKSVLSHHTFTVGGFVPPSGIPPPHPPHLLLDDVAFHLHVLSEESITIMASAGSLLYRIQQRQVLDNYCDQLLSLLVAPSRALPPVDDVVGLVLALFPVAPPRSHDKLFSLLTNLLPALPPASVLRESVLSFLVQCFGSAWFGSAHETYGPPGLSAALSTRKDSVLLHLLNARQLAPDGVATWLLFEQPVKAKSLPLLRASRARLATGVVTLFAHLLQSPLWQPTLLASLEAWVKSAATWTGQRGSLAVTASMATVVLAVNVVASTPGGHPLPATMPTLVAWSLTSPVSMAGHEAPTVATPVSSAAEMREDIQLAQHVHLRSALLRLCRLQAPQTAAADALLKPGLIGLLQLAIQPLAEAVATVFGSDFDIISKLDTVQALLEWILDDTETDGGRKRKLALEMLSTVLFERLPYVNAREVAPWWLVNATQKLQVLGGDVEMEEYRVKGLQHFPTIKLTGVSITAGTGMWFYEVVLLTDGLMQIGWVDMAFEANAIQGQGVGDHTNSWAYDGFRRKKWNVGALEYGDRWHVGDVVGVLLDTDRFEMTYFLNGRSLGVAFEGLHLTYALFPAMSLNVDQAVQLHFAKNQFLYCPTLENAKLQPVANAIVGGVCEHSPSKGRLSVETDHEAAIDRRRTDLIDGLIGLGFSPEWALRCARETSLDINESAAIAWIMEQMEADALAARPSHASQYRMHHLQQLDGLSGHVEKPALTADRPQWAVVATADVAAPSEHRNVLLVDETCEDVYADEGLVVHDLKLPSTSEKRSVGFILSLADHCRDDEILPLYVIAETVLCVWSAQDATHELLRSGSLACDERLAQHAPLFLQYLQRRLLDEATAIDNGGPYEVLLQQLCDASPAFFELLVRDLLGHVRRATAKDMASTPLAPGHAGASAGPNLAWARWLATVVRRLATTHPARTDSLYAPGIWQELWSALGATPNATVRHAIVSILATLLDELPSTTMEALQLQLRVKHLIEWLGEKLRKTRQARVLASAYTQAIFQLTSCLYRYVNPKTTSLVAAPPPALPVLLVEHVTSSTVVLSCSVDGATALELAMETVHSNGHVGLSDFVELVDPVDLHRHLPYTLSHLQPETVYHVRSIVGETRSPSTVLETLPESVLELDAGAVGGNLELLHHNMTARNRVNKKWHAVRASVGFTSGVHAWDVRIDKCVSKNIFVGVCTADACLDNYVGSDAYGWGFLANKAVWHNKTKLQTYGDIFKQGDVVSVVLDLDVGTLSFARNGETFGVAVENLHGTHPSVVAPAYYPAISMYNKDDQVTLVLSSSSDAPVRSAVAGPSSTVLLALASHHKLLEMRSLSLASTAGAYDHWCKWVAREEAVVALDDGTWLLVTTTPDACRPFGLFPGDVIFTSKGMCTILGVAKHELYYSVEAHAPTGSPDAIGRWKVHACRDMVGRPSEFPVTRRHDAPYPLAPLRLSHDEFLEAQRPWTVALDEALLEHVYTTLHFQRYSSVFDVHANDLEPVPLSLTPIQCAARLAWLRYLNLQAHVVLPCISLSDPSMQCLRRRLFRQLPLRYARELLKKTATATTLPATAADELDDDPPDLIKCNVRAPRPCTSFWETSGVDAGTDDDDDDDETDSNVFCQLAAFFASTGTRELRRQYAPPPPPYADGTAPIVTRTFRVHWEAPDATLPLEPAAAYAHVLKEAARVVQSPTYPLLAPTRSSTLWLNLPFLRPTDCFALGQLAGIAWRSGVHLPWHFSPLLWKLLVREPVTLHDWAHVVDDPSDVAVALDMLNWSADDFASHAVAFENDIVTQATAPRYIAGLLESLLAPYKPYLAAMQRGLVSIVPPTCFGLFSAATLAAHLCPAAKLLALQARTQYVGGLRRTSTVVAFFWRILHALSLDEMHLLERFLVGPQWSPYGTLQLTLSPGDAHGGGCPRVERSATDPCVLVLPLYPTQDMLHKKLLVAMTQSPDQYDDNDDDDDDGEAT